MICGIRAVNLIAQAQSVQSTIVGSSWPNRCEASWPSQSIRNKASRFLSSQAATESGSTQGNAGGTQWKKITSLVAGVVIGGIIVTSDWHDTVGRGLIRASRAQQTAIVRGFLFAGVPADYVTSEGCNALHFAARLESVEIVSMLINAGATLGRPVDMSGAPCVIGTPLHVAVRYEVVENARALIEAGSPLDVPDEEGNRALHLAVLATNEESVTALVSLLISAKAPLDAINIEGFTALHLAAREGRSGVVQQLIDAGASLSLETTEGDSALHLAAMYGQLDVVRVLLAAGVPVDSVESQSGKTSLQLAASAGYPHVVRLLLSSGASVDHRDSKGNTPLHDVASSPWGEFFDVAGILIDAQAPVGARNAVGLTPRDLATQWNYQQIAQLLSTKAS